MWADEHLWNLTTWAWLELRRHPVHGPLPALFLLLTAFTGVVDAVCLLSLGRVFVANMTGNLLFVGLALAGVPGFERATSVAALLAFAVGAFVGGRMIGRVRGHRGRVLRNAMAVQAVLIIVAMVVVVATDSLNGAVAPLVAALLALGMGVQNAAVRKLAVPDLPTTVLTMTVTGILADDRGGGTGSLVRRSLAVVAMLLGATVGRSWRATSGWSGRWPPALCSSRRCWSWWSGAAVGPLTGKRRPATERGGRVGAAR